MSILPSKRKRTYANDNSMLRPMNIFYIINNHKTRKVEASSNFPQHKVIKKLYGIVFHFKKTEFKTVIILQLNT